MENTTKHVILLGIPKNESLDDAEQDMDQFALRFFKDTNW